MLQLSQDASFLTSAEQVHAANVAAGWWKNGRYLSTTIMLCISELGEAMEGDRKDLMDDHLPQYKMLHVELADTAIRVLDCAGWLLPFLTRPDVGFVCKAPLVAPNAAEAITTHHKECGVPAQLLACVGNLMQVVTSVPYPLKHNTASAAAGVGLEGTNLIFRVAEAYTWLQSTVTICFGIAALQGVELLPIINAKLAYNAKRADHKLENRAAVNGKKY